MSRTAGTYMTTATGGEAVRAFVPNPLPPAAPLLDPALSVPASAQRKKATREGGLNH